MSLYTLEEFENELEDNDLKALQIIYGALAMGIITFLGVIVFFYLSVDGNSDDSDFINTLTMAHFALLVVILGAVKILYPALLKRSLEVADTAASLFAAIRTSHILRLALFEAAAFFGLIICFLAAQSGVLQDAPFYWINVVSALVMLYMVYIYFPTHRSVVEEYRQFLSQ